MTEHPRRQAPIELGLAPADSERPAPVHGTRKEETQPELIVIVPDDPPILTPPAAMAVLRLIRAAHHTRSRNLPQEPAKDRDNRSPTRRKAA